MTATETRTVRARVVRVSDVPRTAIDWLWYRYISRGTLTVLEGDPGVCKSTFATDLAARVSVGGQLPDGTQLDAAADVVLLSAEDSIATTINPRLQAAGGNLNRVHVLQEVDDPAAGGTRPVVLPDDLDLLEDVVTDTGAALVIIDVLAAYLSGSVDSHRDQDVRRVLHRLAKVAERTGSAVLVVRHLNKSSGLKAIYRGGGSIGLIGATRAGLLVAADPDDDTRRVLAVVKGNLSVKPPALSFRVESDPTFDCGRLVWLGESSHNADSLVASDDRRTDSPRRDAAERFLCDLLADGPVPVADVFAAAEAATVNRSTLRRACEAVGVAKVKHGAPGESGYWTWELSAFDEDPS